MRYSEAVLDYFMAKYNYTEATKGWYEQNLVKFQKFAGDVNIEDITPLLLRRYAKEQISVCKSQTTAHHAVRCILALLKWCEKEGYINPIAYRIEVPKEENTVILAFTEHDKNRLYELCADAETSWLTARNKAIIATLLECGLRANEVVSLQLDDVTLGANAMMVVNGKGRKQRFVPVATHAARLIHQYITGFRQPTDCQYIWMSKKSDNLTKTGLTRMFQHFADAGGLSPNVRVSPHTSRHTFAQDFIKKNNGDVYRLSKILGHTSVVITEGYLRSLQTL